MVVTESVKISKTMRNLLKFLKKKGETYQDTIIRLMKLNNKEMYNGWERFRKTL